LNHLKLPTNFEATKNSQLSASINQYSWGMETRNIPVQSYELMDTIKNSEYDRNHLENPLLKHNDRHQPNRENPLLPS